MSARGRVEFLLPPQGELSFLEVNTRLQVEHTVTEETTGLDLVREQFRVAAGQRLTIGPGEASLLPSRHAIEFRVNAEDPDNDFAPSTGTIAVFRPPGGPGVRLDAGVAEGDVVSGQFDSLLARLIVTGRDRDDPGGRPGCRWYRVTGTLLPDCHRPGHRDATGNS